MNCLNTIKIADYILGVLSFTENVKIMLHLFRCPDCKKNYQKARFLLIEKSDHDSEHSVSKNEALAFVKNLSGSKRHLKVRSGIWTREAFVPVTISSKPVIRTSSEKDINYYQFDRYFSDLETTIYFEKIDDQKFYMDVKATANDISSEHLDLILEKPQGGHIKRPFQNGMAFISAIPFDAYRMVIHKNEVSIGDYYFSINKDGFHEK